MNKPESLDELECLTNTIQWLLNCNKDFLWSSALLLASVMLTQATCVCHSLFQVKNVSEMMLTDNWDNLNLPVYWDPKKIQPTGSETVTKGKNGLNFYYLVLLKVFCNVYILANDNLLDIYVKCTHERYSKCTHEIKFYCPPDLHIPSTLALYTNFSPTSARLAIFSSSRLEFGNDVLRSTSISDCTLELLGRLSCLKDSWWGKVVNSTGEVDCSRSTTFLQTLHWSPLLSGTDKGELNRVAVIPKARSSVFAILQSFSLRTLEGSTHAQWFIVLYHPNLKDTNKFLRACLFPRLVEMMILYLSQYIINNNL